MLRPYTKGLLLTRSNMTTFRGRIRIRKYRDKTCKLLRVCAKYRSKRGLKVEKRQPVAFMSYVHFDDTHENGRLTQFRERLSAEVRMQTGEEFPIFQDRNDIRWGQNWKERLVESLDEVTFLIPILTPSFFKSPHCRDELERFLEREKQLQRNDLVLPVYYVSCPLLDDEAKRATDKLAQAVAAHQYADWRDLRFEPFTAPPIGKMLAQLARQISDALERVQPSQSTATSTSTPGVD